MIFRIESCRKKRVGDKPETLILPNDPPAKVSAAVPAPPSVASDPKFMPLRIIALLTLPVTERLPIPPRASNTPATL